MRTASVAVLAALGLTAGHAAWSPSAQATDVTVAHGIPGVEVDIQVLVDDEETGCLAAVNYLDQASLGDVAPGVYDISISAPSTGDCSGDVVLPGELNLAAGLPVVVIAHLDQNGGFQLSDFTYDDSDPGDLSRFTIFHTAQAPKVDFRLRDLDGRRVKGLPSTTGIANGGQTFPAEVEAEDYDLEVSITPNASFDFKPPSATVPVSPAAGDAVAVFVVGPDEAGEFGAIVVPETDDEVEPEPEPEPEPEA